MEAGWQVEIDRDECLLSSMLKTVPSVPGGELGWGCVVFLATAVYAQLTCSLESLGSCQPSSPSRVTLMFNVIWYLINLQK
jgi:hypothetical protein